MFRSLGLAAGFLLASSAAAGAQQLSDTAGMMAAGVEELGQSIGQAALAGDNVFVTAKGRAKLPAPLADSYFVSIQGKNASAVQAVRDRDQHIARIMQVARRLGIDAEVGESSIDLEVDSEAQQRLNEANNARVQAQMQLHPGVQVFSPSPTPPKIFTAKTSLRFRTASSDTLAAFLDALHADGVDEFSQGLGARGLPFMPLQAEFMGFGSVDTLDPAVWRSASEEAMRSAQVQAQTIAAGSGRLLGPVRQITVVTRSLENGAATESIAVRFALAPIGR